MQDIGLVQSLAVAIDDPVAQMNVIAGNPDNAFYDIQARCFRRQEHHDVAKVDVAVGKQRANPVALGSKLNAIDEDMVTDQQRVLHGTGGDFERLYHECDDEQACDQDGTERGQKLDGGLLRPFFG